jgi:subtilase family serine protease
MATLRPLPLVALAGALLFSAILPAQQEASAVRIVNPIDENQLVTLKGNVNPHAIARNDQGPVSNSLPMAGLTLLLSRTPEQQAAFDAYVQSEYESGSPNYHRWLTPAQIGHLYGPAQSDIAAISAWLTSKGFNVTHVALDGMSISFSGTAGQVTSAFHTEIHQLSVNGKPHIANMSDPQIPAAISPVVSGLKGLHNFLPHPLHRVGNLVQFNQQVGKWQRVASPEGSVAKAVTPNSLSRLKPQFGIGVPGNSSSGTLPYLEEDVSPYDFATIYNVLPLWNASTPITGSGETIAIAGTSDIDLSDPPSYRSAFGLPAGPTLEEAKGVNGIDPGTCTDTTGTLACGLGDLEENSLDAEVSGGVAPGAQIVLVTSGYNSQTQPTNDPIYEDASYVVENHNNTGSNDANIKEVATANILSLSYGECELGIGQSSNVAYYNLWQSAAAEGISVFVATGDSGSPSCDDGQDSLYGNPYEAQYGLSVNGLASTPFDTAVGGTDFSWCKPVYSSDGQSINGCPSSTSSPGPYWNTSNTSKGASAKGYVPETPWNDTCMNPIWAAYLQSLEPLVGASTTSNPEAACNFVYNDWYQIYSQYQVDLSPFVDTVGGSGGASNCVANSTNSSSTTLGTCNSTANTVDNGSGGAIALTNGGWQKPSWQTGVTGIPSDGVRDIPDVSFFAGDGSLDSATLFCISAIAPCTYTTDSNSNAFSLEVGGTSVATPEMAGVMALIDQKEGAAQGLPNPQLYKIAGQQNYSNCSAEGPPSASCSFNSVDQGTNTMPCDYQGQALEGGQYSGLASPNCAALNSGDAVGTLVSSGTTPAYKATAGFNLATGLGSLNVANVVNNWVSDAGTATATLNVTTTPAAGTSGTISLASGVSLVLAVTVTGSSGAATGTISVAGGGYSSDKALSSGAATITIAAGSLAPGSDTLTVTYGGDATYASASQTLTVNAAAAQATVTISTPPGGGNVAQAVSVSVGVTGPGSTAPTGTVTLSGGTYSSTAVTLSTDGTASFNIPAGDLPVGTDPLTADYSGDSSYTHATGTATIVMVSTPLLTPTIKVTATPSTGVDTSTPLTLNVTLTGTGAVAPTGTVTATSSAATSGSTLASGITAQLSAGAASITIPANSLNAGTDSVSVAYVGDSAYAAGTASASITVTQSTYSLSAAAASPASVSPGSSATSAITGTASTTGYVGVVTLSSCSITTSPSNAVNLPTCSVSGTITYAGGSSDTPTGTGTATVTTSSNQSAMLDTHPPRLLYGAGGTVLAFLVFLGIPARRKNWRALLGAIVLLAGLGTLSACGGGSGGTTLNTATSPGAYTFTVTGAGNDSASTQSTATFNLTVN